MFSATWSVEWLSAAPRAIQTARNAYFAVVGNIDHSPRGLFYTFAYSIQLEPTSCAAIVDLPRECYQLVITRNTPTIYCFQERP